LEINIGTDHVTLKTTAKEDIDFIINSEREPANAQYVGQWTKEQHINALLKDDILHLTVVDKVQKPVGYVIIAGLTNPNRNIEFMRVVISEKGKGYGRETLKLVKKIAFEQLNAHRLWLDVRLKNKTAQSLYKSEGFIEEGILRECVLYNENYKSLIIMSILRNEYEE
jgi:Acetyltransferases, including N-acetylases of ribosomal proteins